ncbi:hypothetical protein [Pseudarthrobacter sp. NIBRBAC000502770]|uniref:hypothetical protein n=1 Tax=Pseudarthrobacter sp. NIBRBAC000502770 TaxID=2590785 RepID=UPI001FEE7E0E|nr:hypothetical protein [Pseudarthrobacter sp. NIBRBAC000502770]
MRVLARTGLYDTAKYASPSEARMAVLNHFAACGWTLAQVRLELGGQFPASQPSTPTPTGRNA